MLAFMIRRLAQSVFVMLIVALISFAMFNFVGDPIHNMVGQQTTMEEREQLRQDLGLNDPFYMQFSRFIQNALKGDFGISYRQGRKVSEMIAEYLPATLELSLVALIFALGMGIPLGIYAGIHRESWLSKFFLSASLVGVSMPTFLIGVLLMWFFAIVLKSELSVPFTFFATHLNTVFEFCISHINSVFDFFKIDFNFDVYQIGTTYIGLPSSGRGEIVKIGDWWTSGFFKWEGIKALILPGITLGLLQMTIIMRLVRSEMLEILRADYIKFARARGLPDNKIYYRHALKNSLIPVITVAGLQIGTIIAFAIVTEEVFTWPGVGRMFLMAIQNVDIPVMSAYLIFVGLIFVLVNLIVDMLYFLVDPRLKSGISVAKKVN